MTISMVGSSSSGSGIFNKQIHWLIFGWKNFGVTAVIWCLILLEHSQRCQSTKVKNGRQSSKIRENTGGRLNNTTALFTVVIFVLLHTFLNFFGTFITWNRHRSCHTGGHSGRVNMGVSRRKRETWHLCRVYSEISDMKSILTAASFFLCSTMSSSHASSKVSLSSSHTTQPPWLQQHSNIL